MPRDNALLLDIIKNEKINKRISDWSGILHYAARSGLAPYIFYIIKKEKCPDIPNDVMKRFQNIYFQNLRKTEAQKRFLVSILKDLKRLEIDAMPLKGIALAEMAYGAAELRPFSSDIDLLMKKKDSDGIYDYFTGLGYKKIFETDWSTLFSGKDKPCFLDIHWQYCPPQEVYVEVEKAWENAQTFSIDGFDVKVPSYDDLLIYLAVVTNNDSCRYLKHFFDIHMLVKRHKNDMSWFYTEKAIKNGHLGSYCYLPFTLAKRFFGTELPENFIKRIKPNIAKRAALNMLFDPKWTIELKRPSRIRKIVIEGGIVSGAGPVHFIRWMLYRLRFEYRYSQKHKGAKSSLFGMMRYASERISRLMRPSSAKTRDPQ